MTADETERSYRLIKLIKTLKVKQKDFAKNVGVKPVYVSHLVNRHRKITFEMAQKISRSYPVSIEWLLAGEGEMLSDKKPDELEAVAQEGLLEKLLRRVDALEKEVHEIKKGREGA